MSDRAEPVSDQDGPKAGNPEQILRFLKSERRLHWAIAIPFMVCYTTAAILILVYNPNPTRPFREIVSWVHRLSGVCLIVLPPWTILWHRHDFMLHLHNIREAWTWTLQDLKWLILFGPATLSSKISQPDQGKFNAGEKINFMTLTLTYPVYIVTGLMIWFAGVAYLSWMIHVSMAMLVATPLMWGHIFLATVNPDTRVGLSGMISGFVDRHWAQHHYRHWFDEKFGSGLSVVYEAVLEAQVPELSPVPIRYSSDESDQVQGSWVHRHDRIFAL
jgi:formate dehydrogenase subunit gamma